MTEMDMINQAYIKALATIKRAAKAGKQYIRLQSYNDSYRLAAVMHSFGGETSYRSDMLPTDWARNVIYRLRDVCLLPVSADAIDEYFDRPEGKHDF